MVAKRKQRTNRYAYLKQTIIRDPVHNYILLSSLEKKIVNSIYFQRLRGLKQNGTAYLSYPSCQTNRFEHSLGVMAVISDILENALKYSNEYVTKEFLEKFRKELKLKRADNVTSKIIQIARIAALIHDIGHFPFSHVIEYAIQRKLEYVQQIYPTDEYKQLEGILNTKHLHEWNSIKIANLLVSSPSKEEKDLLDNAIRVLETPISDPSPFSTIKRLISSNLDADRIDYVLRDGRSMGGDVGNFDARRLITSMRLTSIKVSDHYEYLILPTFQGVSSIEALILERYKIYKWLNFHHKVVLTEFLLGRIFEILIINYSNCKVSELFNINDFYYLQWGKIICDDTYLITLYRKVYQHIDVLNLNDITRMELKSYLEIILFRYNNSFSLWKDSEQYQENCTKITNKVLNKMIEHHKTLSQVDMNASTASNLLDGSLPFFNILYISTIVT